MMMMMMLPRLWLLLASRSWSKQMARPDVWDGIGRREVVISGTYAM
jgi:hypothetical protein